MAFLITLVLTGFALVGCDRSGPHLPTETKRTVTSTTTTTGTIPGFDQVQPILAKNCAACHPARSQPDWNTYSQAKTYVENGKLLRRVVIEKSMPPANSPQASTMTEEERQIIAAWASAGGPEHGSSEASAQPPSTTTESAIEAAARPQVNAMLQQCLSCHSPVADRKRDHTSKIPLIAGQSADYIMIQLKSYRDHSRMDLSGSPTTMNDIAGFMTEDHIEEAAKYFSSLEDLPKEGGFAKQTLSEIQPPLRTKLHDGLMLAVEYCNTCHMNPGISNSTVPRVAGQSEAYLRNQLLYFKSQVRKNPLMYEYVRTLSEPDMSALAFYFSKNY